MKIRLFVFVLAAVLLLCGCAATGERLDSVGASAEMLMDQAKDAVESAAMGTTQPATGDALLTREEAQAIALEHAGFTADQVRYLRTEYEIDDGIPQYEVDFHQGTWEYSYEINAETGAILSFEKDD